MAAGDFLPWSSASLLSARRNSPGAATFNGFVYCVGGSTTSQVVFAEIQNDGTLSAWAATTALPVIRVGCSSFINNGFLYCIGGEDGAGAPQSTVFFAPVNLDGTVGAWASTSALPAVRASHLCHVNNSFAYVTGGYDGAGDAQSDVYFAAINIDGTLAAWASTTSLPVPRDQHSGAVGGSFVYAAGGVTTGGGFLDTVVVAPINMDGTIGAWVSTTSLPVPQFGHSSIIHSGFFYIISGSETTVSFAPINMGGTIGAWAATADFGSARQHNVSLLATTPAGALPAADVVYVVGGAGESTAASKPTWFAFFDAGGGPLRYLMRAFDTNGAVNRFVYWYSEEIDSSGSVYSGSAGPLNEIVVFRKLRTPI